MLPPSLLRRVGVLFPRTFCSSFLSTVLLGLLVATIGRPQRPPAGSTPCLVSAFYSWLTLRFNSPSPRSSASRAEAVPALFRGDTVDAATVPTAMAACTHAQMLHHLPWNRSQPRTFDFPGNAFVPSPTTHAHGPTRSQPADLRNLPADVHRLICAYLPRDSLHEMAIFAVTLHDHSLNIYCHEASKQGCGKLLQRALQEQIPLQSFHTYCSSVRRTS